MKLLNCNIQNFGTLSGFKTDFNEGLTVINEENGFGKSTLAVFIKAMFYGLPQNAKRSLDENERKKYTPWQGGAFGGTLDFEVGGKKYRVERFFGGKEKDDTFRLFDLAAGQISNDFTTDLGLELFGIDADSFERSVYVPQSGADVAMNNSLRAKLTGLVENSDDISNFDSAVKALEKRAREYSVANGARGAIADKTREIEELEAKLNDGVAAADNLKRVKAELQELYQRASMLTERKKNIREQITAASDAAARAEQAKRREELTASVTALNTELQTVRMRYPEGFPDGQALTDAADTAELLTAAENQLSMLESETTDSVELERLKKFFGDSVPDEQEISDCKTDFARMAQMQVRAEALSDRVPESADAVPQKNGKVFKLSLIIAVLLAAVGAVTLVWQTAVGVILIVAGVLDAGVAAFIYLKNLISAGASHNGAALRQEYETLQAEIARLYSEVSQFTQKYMPDADAQTALDTVSQALRDFRRLQQSVAEQKRKVGSRRQRADECRENLNAFFKKYGVGLEGSFSDRLTAVKKDMDLSARLECELRKQNDKLSALPPEQERLTVATDVGNREELLEAEKQLTATLDEVQRLASVRESEVNRFSAMAEALPDIEEQLDRLRIERGEMTDRLNIINKTLELLQKAKNDLSLRYLDRMTDGFKKYSAVLEGHEEQALIDTDLEVRVDREGASRDKEYFSTGYRDMIDIAMRLALCDALFDNECPMLILDDPFVNLDDRRVANSLKMLKKLAEQRQIVYLTCHSSRC